MTDLPHLVSATEIARLAEVNASALSNWRLRHSDFPKRVHSDGDAGFRVDQVAAWLDARRIPKNRLKRSESATTTYGDRFRANLAPPAVPLDTQEHPAQPRKNFGVETLRRMRDVTHESLDSSSFTEFTLGLLHVRINFPQLWSRLTDSSSVEVPYELHDINRYLSRESSITLFPKQGPTDAELWKLLDLVDRHPLPASGDVATLSGLIDRLVGVTDARWDEHTTPPSLIRLMVDLTELGPRDRLYDPFCRVGEILAGQAVHRSPPDAPRSLAGDGPSERQLRVTWLRASILGLQLDLGPPSNTIITPRIDEEFDVVLTNPPFSLKISHSDLRHDDPRWRYGTPPPHNADFAWLQHALSSLAPGGRAAVLMSSGTTFRESSESVIRTGMVEAGAVECVVSLPVGLFRSSGVSVSLWLLRHPSTRASSDVLLIDATQLGELNGRHQRTLTDTEIDHIIREHRLWRSSDPDHPYLGVPDFSRAVPLAELREHNHVLNSRIYVEQRKRQINFSETSRELTHQHRKLTELRSRANRSSAALDATLEQLNLKSESPPADWRRVPLGELCALVSGPGVIEDRQSTGPGIPIVLPRNIRFNRILGSNLDVVEPRAGVNLDRYRLSAGDIVCTRTGELGRNGVISARQAGWLLGPGCIRVRPVDGVDSSYLNYCLTSPQARDWIERHATGSVISAINTKVLAELPVLLPPMETQREIGAALRAFDDMAEIHDEIRATTTELRDALLPLLTSGTAQVPGPS